MSDGPRTASQPRRRGFYYHRRPTTACRRRVTALWSQFPPRPHPQPPTLRPSNNAAPRTPRATPMHNLTVAAFADATSTPPAPTGGFTTIDAPPRRVAGVSQPYGRNSPHAPTHNRQPRHLQQAHPRAHPQPPATASSMRISRHEPPVATAHASRRAPPRSTGAWPPWRHRLPLRHPQTQRAPTLVSCMIRRCPRWNTAT